MKYLLSLIILLLFFNSSVAQTSEKVKGDAVFLFAYQIDEGEQQQFNEGYKSHLQWHRDHDDHLPWYGWYVITGENTGLFVDGTFGISFEAFDNRVAPAQDAAHARKAFVPHSKTAYRKILELKTNLSTATLLEDWNPSPYLEVYMFSIKPGMAPAFEKTISKLVEVLKKNGTEWEFTFYRQLSGGTLPAYLMMVPKKGYAFFGSDKAFTSLTDLIHFSFDTDKAEELSKNLSKYINQIHGETWAYRSNLSYFPEGE